MSIYEFLNYSVRITQIGIIIPEFLVCLASFFPKNMLAYTCILASPLLSQESVQTNSNCEEVNSKQAKTYSHSVPIASTEQKIFPQYQK